MATLASFWIAFIVGLAGIVAYTQAAVDCNKHINIRLEKDCCKIPKPNLTAYSNQCPVDENENPTSPCAFECVFNASQVLQGDQLNMPNVRKMLTSLVNNDQEMVAAFYAGFEKCGPLIKQRLSAMKANSQGSQRKPPGLPGCQLIAVHYLMCAHTYVFSSACPAKAWTKSTECENAREYVRKCGDRRPSGKKRRKHSSGGSSISLNRTVAQ